MKSYRPALRHQKLTVTIPVTAESAYFEGQHLYLVRPHIVLSQREILEHVIAQNPPLRVEEW